MRSASRGECSARSQCCSTRGAQENPITDLVIIAANPRFVPNLRFSCGEPTANPFLRRRFSGSMANGYGECGRFRKGISDVLRASFQCSWRRHGISAIELCFSLRPHQTRCPSKGSSMLNVQKGMGQSERPPLQPARNCPMRISASCLRTARPIPVTLSLYPHVVTARQIVQSIRECRWTSTQVVTAFIKSAIRAQDETNCITEGA